MVDLWSLQVSRFRAIRDIIMEKRPKIENIEKTLLLSRGTQCYYVVRNFYAGERSVIMLLKLLSRGTQC